MNKLDQTFSQIIEQTQAKPSGSGGQYSGIYRMGYHSRATIHGFRSLASSILNESGKWNPDAIERQLAHSEKDQVRAAYNYANYMEERRCMMQWYADHLDELKSKAKP